MTTNTDITILSVSNLNTMIRDILQDSFDEIWVEGEVSNLIHASSGHYYFTLKDKDAQVRCAFFKGAARQTKVALENGQHLLVKAQVSVYAPRGDYQLIVSRVEEIGDGVLQRAFEALKKRLASEGLFEETNKKPLPSFPQRIGVVTSPTGAAIRDILHVLARRFPAIEVFIYPTLVQGNEAAAQIVKAIALANKHNHCDVLIIGRGGGSLEDLWSFNEENVARAIFASKIPTVSAVGHEIDFTIADFVADIRAPTPSAAAELVSPDQEIWFTFLRNAQSSLLNAFQKRVARYSETLQHLAKRLKHPQYRLEQHSQRVDDLTLRLYDKMQRRLERLSSSLDFLHSRLNKERLEGLLHLSQYRLAQNNKFLSQGIQKILESKRQILEQKMGALHALSPLAVMERGFAVIKESKTQQFRYRALENKPGDKIEISYVDGKVAAIVEKVF